MKEKQRILKSLSRACSVSRISYPNLICIRGGVAAVTDGHFLLLWVAPEDWELEDGALSNRLARLPDETFFPSWENLVDKVSEKPFVSVDERTFAFFQEFPHIPKINSGNYAVEVGKNGERCSIIHINDARSDSSIFTAATLAKAMRGIPAGAVLKDVKRFEEYLFFSYELKNHHFQILVIAKVQR
jgi:hypothetical protein